METDKGTAHPKIKTVVQTHSALKDDSLTAPDRSVKTHKSDKNLQDDFNFSLATGKRHVDSVISERARVHSDD